MGKVDADEEPVTLANGPGSSHTPGAPLSLLFGEVKLSSKFPPRTNSRESQPWIIWRQTKQARNQGTKDRLWRTPD